MSLEINAALLAVEQTDLNAYDTRTRVPLVVGLCGAQGSGKSTLADALAACLRARDLTVAVLSLDDLYLTRTERHARAATVHSLFETRGVPGTHDVALGLELLGKFDAGRQATLPRFDKERDDRAPTKRWDQAAPNTEVVIFEGWCVGAAPEPEEALREPVNSLESEEDPQGIWRTFVNTALGGEYQRLFKRIDVQILLAAPDYAVVQTWRIEQEHALRIRVGDHHEKIMSDSEVTRFVQHFERLTRHILKEMPLRADLTIELAVDRTVKAYRRRAQHI